MTDLAGSIAALFWTFAFLFMICEFGERVSAGFYESYEIICELQWYSTNIQRMLHIVMISVQEPCILRGFGNIPCAREQAKKVKRNEFFFDIWNPKKFLFSDFQKRTLIFCDTS